MAGITLAPAPQAPAQGTPVGPVASPFSPTTYKSREDTYNDLLAQALATRTPDVLSGLAKLATSGFLGWQKTKNEDKADAQRQSATDAFKTLLGGQGAAPTSATASPLTNVPTQGVPTAAQGNVPSLAGGQDAEAVWQRMVNQESRGKQFGADGKPLTSSAGAVGIAQVMPGTAPEAAKMAGLPWDENKYRTDPDYNLALGHAYYLNMVQKYGDPIQAAGAYNAGPGTMDQYLAGKRGLPSEMQNYMQVASGGVTQAPQPASMQAAYPSNAPPSAQAAPQQVPGLGAMPSQDALLQFMSDPWADPGQKQVAQYLLQQQTKQQVPVDGININGKLVNPRTGAVIADLTGGSGGGFNGQGADIQAANYLVQQGKLTKEQAAQWLLSKQAVGQNGQVDLITPDAMTAGQSVTGAPVTQAGQPVGGAPTDMAPQAPQGAALPVGTPDAAGPQASPAAPSTPQNVPGVVTVRQPSAGMMNQEQSNAALYADRMRVANQAIEQFGNAGMSRGERVLGSIPFVGNSLVSGDFQQNEQAQRDFASAVLRRESGAAISQSEFDNVKQQYFPQPGDGPDVIAQKARNRQVAIDGISRAAGGGYHPSGATSAPAAPANYKSKYGLE